MKRTDFKKNYIYRLVYELFIFILPLITTPYISRVLGAEGVGEFSFTYSVTAYFMMLGALGTENYGTREIARNSGDKQEYSRLFWEIELIRVISFLVCLLPWFIMIISVSRYRLLYIALTPYIIGTMFDISWFYFGIEKIDVVVITNAAVRVLGIFLLFTMVRNREDVVVYCIINSLILLIANLLMWFFLPGYLIRIRWSGIHIGNHFRETLIYFLPSVANTIYMSIDKTLIGVITGNSYENGYYEQASRVITVAKAFTFWVYSSIAIARMSYLYETEGPERVKEKTADSIDFILLLGYGAIFGLIGISHNLVPVFFGEDYGPVEILIYMMLPLVLIIGIGNCLESHYYIPAGKRVQSAKFILTGAIINIIMNLCFIPWYGARGAVVASVAAEIIITTLYMRNCNGFLTLKQIGQDSVKRIIAGICMAVIVYITGNLPYNSICVLLLQLFVGAVSYTWILFCLNDSMLRNIMHGQFGNMISTDKNIKA